MHTRSLDTSARQAYVTLRPISGLKGVQMPKELKITVSERALVQRVNRKIKDDRLVLKRSRGARMIDDVGRFYLLNFYRNILIGKDLDLEAYARQVGALQLYEELEEHDRREGD